MSHRRGLLLAAAAFTSWGLLSPGNEILLRQMGPFWMQTIRSLLASIVLAAWIGASGMREARQVFRHPRLRTGLFFGTFLSFGLFAMAQDRIPATFATLGFYTSPLWTAALGHRILGERVGPWFIPAMAAMFVGAWMALTGGGAQALPDVLGLVMAVGSGLTWAVFAVMLRQSSAEVAWKPLLLASMAMALPLFIILALVFEPVPDVSGWVAATWQWTVIQVAVPTILAMGLFQVALRYAPAGQVNLLVGLELAGTVFFAWLLLDARFDAVQLAGIVTVLVAVSGYLWQRTSSAPVAAAPPL